MSRINFSTSLLLAPIAYAIHHFEENVVFNFREWRLLYFPDSNALSTELVFMIITSVTLIYVISHNIFQNSASAKSAILFLFASQLHNVLFHAGATLMFQHFSPGLYTALLLYLPVNAFIVYKAFQEKWLTWRSLIALFVVGGVIFWSFEVFGPMIIGLTILVTFVWTIREHTSQKTRHEDNKLAKGN